MRAGCRSSTGLWRARQWLLAALCAAQLGWSSCSGAPLPSWLVPGEPRRNVASLDNELEAGAPHTIVLIALDGVRWTEIFQGVESRLGFDAGLHAQEILPARELVPNLHALIGAGLAIGHDGNSIRASGPAYVSLPGYMEMFTGVWPHGCARNGCGAVTIPTIADGFASEPGVGPEDVAVISSWEQIEHAAARDPKRITISTGRNHGVTRERLRYDARAARLLERGEQAGPDPGIEDFRRDRETADIALHYLRTHRPRFLFLGLGEPDEYGHRRDYKGYLRALVRADDVIGEVADVLVKYQAEGRAATLLVTTDHGRAKDFASHGGAPESAGVWLVAAGSGISRAGVVTPLEQLHLVDVAGMIRALGGPNAARLTRPAVRALLVPEIDDAARTTVAHR